MVAGVCWAATAAVFAAAFLVGSYTVFGFGVVALAVSLMVSARGRLDA